MTNASHGSKVATHRFFLWKRFNALHEPWKSQKFGFSCINTAMIQFWWKTVLTYCHPLCLDFELFLILCRDDEWLFFFSSSSSISVNIANSIARFGQQVVAMPHRSCVDRFEHGNIPSYQGNTMLLYMYWQSLTREPLFVYCLGFSAVSL